MDLLFWLVTGAAVFIILLNADFAQLRLYTFAGMGIGIFIYFMLFSEYILKSYRFITYAIAKIIRLVFIVVTFPFKLVYHLIWVPANYVKKYLYRAGRNLKKWLLKKLKALKNKLKN
jgi:hypothetical protein